MLLDFHKQSFVKTVPPGLDTILQVSHKKTSDDAASNVLNSKKAIIVGDST